VAGKGRCLAALWEGPEGGRGDQQGRAGSGWMPWPLDDLKISCIDLLKLRKVMAGIHNFLECVDMQISTCCQGGPW